MLPVGSGPWSVGFFHEGPMVRPPTPDSSIHGIIVSTAVNESVLRQATGTLSICIGRSLPRPQCTNIQCWGDGGIRPDQGISSYSWVLKAWYKTQGPAVIAVGGKFLRWRASGSMEAEAAGVQKAMDLRLNVISGNPEFGPERSGAMYSRKRARVLESLTLHCQDPGKLKTR